MNNLAQATFDGVFHQWFHGHILIAKVSVSQICSWTDGETRDFCAGWTPIERL